MSAGNQNMSTVLKRLEAIAARLEDVADMQSTAMGLSSPRSGPSEPPMPQPISLPTEDSPSVKAFSLDIYTRKVKPFITLTESFAIPPVTEQAKLVEKLYASVLNLIRTATICRKPDQNAFATLLTDLQKDVDAITNIKETNRKERDWFNHLSMVADGAPAVGWVTLENKPGPYVAEVRDASQFYGNRVIKDWKEKDQKHIDWVRCYIDLLEGMRKYVMEHHATGLVWNSQGMSIDEYKSALAQKAGPPPPPAPAPPPPAPPPPPPAAAPAPAAGGGGLGAVFADLNRGSDVTKGLRKVDKSEMTHKNPALRAGNTVPASSSPAAATATGKRPTKPTKPSSLQAKKPAKFALEGNKWIIENQEGETLTVEDVERNHVVNLYSCKKTTVVVKGKINAVTMVNCQGSSLLVDSVISSVSITNSPSFAVQITGTVPTIQVDTTDSGMIYLSKDCLDADITTAKCSAINVSVPVPGEEDGIFSEHPVPEMLMTKFKDGKLVTTVVEHVG
ncbi:adenylyl cyclase-associated protein [Vararia minispora EC-137]|uniref:Adenylyl cyclase-associated protein n=1 Tax=Vararia minispora EC-137 TaxID=1314806 RepID=A0ACB8QIT5_9AGAM|nr:adenylyl cyclase-associated protein [Vararia minispora EC-137]